MLRLNWELAMANLNNLASINTTQVTVKCFHYLHFKKKKHAVDTDKLSANHKKGFKIILYI